MFLQTSDIYNWFSLQGFPTKILLRVSYTSTTQLIYYAKEYEKYSDLNSMASLWLWHYGEHCYRNTPTVK
jgi:hypothetical protein